MLFSFFISIARVFLVWNIEADLVTGEGHGRGKVGSTNGAGLVGTKPEVYAFLVEDMTAHGQEAEEAVVLEFKKANRAFEAVVFLILPEILHGGVEEGWEALEKGRFEASRR